MTLDALEKEKLDRINRLSRTLGVPEVSAEEFVVARFFGDIDSLIEDMQNDVHKQNLAQANEDMDEFEITEFDITLGMDVEDTVTGYIGVVTAITHYSHCESLVFVETDTQEKWITISRLQEI